MHLPILNNYRYSLAVFILLSVSACSEIRLADMPYGGPRYKPTPASFRVCFSHGCNQVASVSLTRMEWQQVIDPLSRHTMAPDEERNAIAESIARLERVAGQHTGTHNDKGGNFAGFGQAGQMDCIDESTNSTTYLLMIEQANLLRWHKVSGMRTRFGFQAGFPHSTAIIRLVAG